MPTSNRSTRARSAFGALFALSVLAACASAELTRGGIVEAVGAAPCEIDAQCRVLALGERACGGAEEFIAWSILHNDAERLGQMAERYAQQRAEAHRKSGRVSTCEVRVEPAVRCVRPDPNALGRCLLQPEASASDARG